MTVRWIAPLVVSALIGCASGPEPEYALVQADATIPFGGQTVRNFSVGPEDTLILQASGNAFIAQSSIRFVVPYCARSTRSA